MISEKELDLEKDYLNKVYTEIQSQKRELEEIINLRKDALKQQLEYSVDAYYDMDSEEFSREKLTIENQDIQLWEKKQALKKVNLLEKSAYFGRVDFNNQSYYIGISNLLNNCNQLCICDWRAPVSSLYYDYELGEACYNAPTGSICGEITKKRQYKVNRNELTYAFDSQLTIGDDILKETLSGAASEKMKNIVSTIQKEQNEIIRRSIVRNLLIQGEAGSGKTSIALHRAAFLMYKQIGRLSAGEIMILSPNALFSDYISNVLPELGENNVVQSTFETLAACELPKVKFLSREDTVGKVLHGEDINYKFSFKFKEDLDKFLGKFANTNFVAKDVKVGEKTVSQQEIEELYKEKYKSKKISVKLEWLTDYILEKLELPNELYSRVLGIVYTMLTNQNLLEIYGEFLKENNQKFNADENQLAFEDIPAVLYIKDYILGLSARNSIKYLIVDEMQDYSPLHYEILNKLFDCNKLILGDINQNVLNVYNEKSLNKICKIIDNCDLVKLTKSYRSTYEISKYCQKIKNLNYDVVQRHGKEVQEIVCANEQKMIDKINEIANVKKGKIAVVCRDNEEGQKLQKLLKDFSNEGNKIVISSAKAKGIEFDAVIIPNVQKYRSLEERNVLYISATRALHELYLISL